MQTMKVFLLMAGLTALLVVIGGWIGGSSGALVFFVLAAVMNFAMYWWSDKVVLRMYRAKTVGPDDAPELYRMVDRLRQRAGLPMPTVAVAPSQQPNAFATGRNHKHAVVCVTTGIMQLVSREELEGVIAHELAHIKNRDMLISTVAAGMAGAISYLPYLLMFGMGGDDDDGGHPFAQLGFMLLAPIGAMLIQFAVSRQREFEADRVGAEILGNPLPLASALTRLDAMAKQIPMQVAPAAAPLAQVNPLAAHGGGVTKLFSTHPPTEERVARLQEMARGR